MVSEFGSLNNSLAIGVSETNDPAGAYNVYQYVFSGFPDYPKYGVWHDGYYGTVNLNGQTTADASAAQVRTIRQEDR